MPCSYCIVPSTRGREVSRPLDELVDEVRAAGRRRRARGHAARPERQLLRARPAPAAALVRRAAARGRRDRRASTASATRARTRRTCARTSSARTPSCRRVCEHIHLPLQSGSSRDPQGDAPHLRPRALPRPRRADPRARPDCALTTDIIVGFPGETEADFARDARGRRGGRLRRRLHVHLLAAPRTPRRPTFADDFVPHEVAVERMERLVEVVQRRARERAQRFVGRTLDVLVEGTSRTDPSRLRGRTRHNKVVNFAGLAAPGEIVAGRDRRGDEPDAHRQRIAGLARRLNAHSSVLMKRLLIGRTGRVRAARARDGAGAAASTGASRRSIALPPGVAGLRASPRGRGTDFYVGSIPQGVGLEGRLPDVPTAPCSSRRTTGRNHIGPQVRCAVTRRTSPVASRRAIYVYDARTGRRRPRLRDPGRRLRQRRGDHPRRRVLHGLPGPAALHRSRSAATARSGELVRLADHRRTVVYTARLQRQRDRRHARRQDARDRQGQRRAAVHVPTRRPARRSEVALDSAGHERRRAPADQGKKLWVVRNQLNQVVAVKLEPRLQRRPHRARR